MHKFKIVGKPIVGEKYVQEEEEICIVLFPLTTVSVCFSIKDNSSESKVEFLRIKTKIPLQLMRQINQLQILLFNQIGEF